MSLPERHETWRLPIGDGPYGFRFEVEDEDCREKDMTGATAARWVLYSVPQTPLVTKVLGDGIEVVERALQLTIDKADLVGLSQGIYFSHARATDAAGVTRTIAHGFVELYETPAEA